VNQPDGSYTYCISTTGLPDDFALNASGLLSGTPLESGTYSFNVAANDCDTTTPGDTGDFTLRVLPANDNCSEAMPISEGAVNFGNTGATTDGPDEPSRCSASGDTNVSSDIWYRYKSNCTGIATAELCGSEYDTRLAVYGSLCPAQESAIACNDDACGLSGLQSRVSFDVTSGQDYLLRVGGFSGDQGSGQLLVTCINDCNSNGIDDLMDIGNKQCER
jgi:hypothetical protein